MAMLGLRPQLKFCALILAMAVHACGPDDGADDAASLKQNSGRGRTLGLFFAGNASCDRYGDQENSPLGASFYGRVEDLSKSVIERDGGHFDILVSCFTLDSKLYITSTKPGAPVERLQDSDVTTYIAGWLNQAAENTRLLLVGHSYGGWLALKTLPSLVAGLPAPPERVDMVTIDPISKKNCKLSHPMGCSGAPSDITDDDYARISELTRRWVNFYQRWTPVVRSSAIAKAHANFRLDAGHTTIDTHPDVWQQISELVHL